jgi:hypothetical protein
MAADDDRCEHLLARAEAAATLPEPFRRRAILGIIEERLLAATPEARFQGEFPDNPGPIEPFIFAAYPAIERFWRAWLYDPLSANELIHLMATTAATGMIDRQRRSNLLRPVVERYSGDIATDTAATVVRWLSDHPDAEEVLPPSVIAYLNRASDGGVGTTAAPPQEGAQQPEPTGREPEDQSTAPKPTHPVASTCRPPGPVPGTGRITRKRELMARHLLATRRKGEEIPHRVGREMTRKKFKFAGNGTPEYERAQLMRVMRKLDRQNDR